MDRNEWSIADARLHLSEVIKRSKDAPQVLENRGKAVAAVVDSETLARLQGLVPQTKGAKLLEKLARIIAQGPEDLSIDCRRKSGPRDPFNFESDGEID